MKHQPPQVLNRFSRCRVGELLISAITLAELEFGVIASGTERARNREALDLFLVDVPVRAFDGLAAAAYAPVRWETRLRRRDLLDKLIAAHAIALEVILVTNNPGDFQAYSQLQIENWVA